MKPLIHQIVLVAFCFLKSLSGQAQVDITGVVTYKGKPLQDGYLYSDTSEAFTDSLGRFAITVDSLGSELYVGLLGHGSMVYKVNSGGHHAIDLPRKYGKRSRRQHICGFCFTSGTQVCMSDGSCRTINSVTPGEEVMACEGNELTVARVVRMDSVVHDNLVRLDLSDGTWVTCTMDHPIQVSGKGWCAVRPTKAQRSLGVMTMVPGDRCLVLAEGSLREVLLLSVQEEAARRMTYNLTTDRGSYFANGILVSDEHTLQRAVRMPSLP